MPMAQINGARTHYHVTGSGTPILFITPPLLTGESFNYQRAQLSDDFQVITYDIRGHGRSERSPVPLSYPLLIEDIKQLIDHLGLEKVYICGYSTGGQLALEAMLTYPDRFLGGIIISGMSEVSDWYLRARVSAAQYIARLGLKRALAALISYGIADSRQSFKQMYRHAKHGNTRDMSRYYQITKKNNCTSRLRRITAPILLIYGKKDWSFYRYARILQKHLHHYTMHMIDGVSHQIPIKAAGEMNRTIRAWIHEQSGMQIGHDQLSERKASRQKLDQPTSQAEQDEREIVFTPSHEIPWDSEPKALKI